MGKRVIKTRQKSQRPGNLTDVSAKISLGIQEPVFPDSTAIAPARTHAASYHWSLLLSNKESCDALLEWFTSIYDDREMPWRKPWLNPSHFSGTKEELGKALAKRAYEVWVSEIMLQQTRVSTVIPYHKKWIAKWPTVEHLAEAEHDDVLAVWKGLGYYSRATRLHQGAKDMVDKSKHLGIEGCPIPATAKELLAFSGIGPYTAGAISSIAFGEPEPVLDGNVSRVLSRQLGLYFDAKEKKPTDFLWKVADRLVKHVSGPEKSAVPGQWNQALMELGSTICTPRPKCEECPIRGTCRAYAEGEVLAKKGTTTDEGVRDIEDACTLCEQLDTEDLVLVPEEVDEDMDDVKPVAKKRKRETKATNTISHYFASSTAPIRSGTTTEESNAGIEASQKTEIKKRKASSFTSKAVISYCSLFPKKVAKKKVAEEECVVCMVELRMGKGKESKWLIEQRPAKGLLASLWQFPQSKLPVSGNSVASRMFSAQKLVSGLDGGPIDLINAKHHTELSSLVHIFSHLKLTMHVHLFSVEADIDGMDTSLAFPGPPRRKWVDTEAMENESLSTGMQRCWKLVDTSSSQ